VALGDASDRGCLTTTGSGFGHLLLFGHATSRERLFRGLRDLIEGEYGGRIVKGYATTLYVARRK
jgi:hypothetical protein